MLPEELVRKHIILINTNSLLKGGHSRLGIQPVTGSAGFVENPFKLLTSYETRFKHLNSLLFLFRLVLTLFLLTATMFKLVMPAKSMIYKLFTWQGSKYQSRWLTVQSHFVRILESQSQTKTVALPLKITAIKVFSLTSSLDSTGVCSEWSISTEVFSLLRRNISFASQPHRARNDRWIWQQNSVNPLRSLKTHSERPQSSQTDCKQRSFRDVRCVHNGRGCTFEPGRW